MTGLAEITALEFQRSPTPDDADLLVRVDTFGMHPRFRTRRTVVIAAIASAIAATGITAEELAAAINPQPVAINPS